MAVCLPTVKRSAKFAARLRRAGSSESAGLHPTGAVHSPASALKLMEDRRDVGTDDNWKQLIDSTWKRKARRLD